MSSKATETRLSISLNLLHLSSTKVVTVQVAILVVTLAVILVVTLAGILVATQEAAKLLQLAVSTSQNILKVETLIKASSFLIVLHSQSA